jgi:hypothetical protein
MKRLFVLSVVLGAVLAAAGVASSAGGAAYTEDGVPLAEAGLNPQELAGAEIWYRATAGTARFTTYTFQQRLGVLVDWFRVLRADRQATRFYNWGLIHDPSCCMPGSSGCPARSLEETYGFEWCAGDDRLLPYVGKTGYRDPACDFKDPGGPGDKQNPCDLQFGTSTGALGFRKFPNPRFNAERWRKVNGSLGTWEGFTRPIPGDPNRASHLGDPSIEPPFLIGMACGACHISFNPLHPPKDPANPTWQDLKGAVGNQYTLAAQIFASGMSPHTIEFQLFAHDRPGTVDTSAMPNDVVHNPGTMNAIINFKRRPVFPNEQVRKWRAAASCPPGADVDDCWCEPGKPGKCKQRSLQAETVPHVLKGGEDSIGLVEAIQRVYFNIGSCAEQCWLNHLTDARQLDPTQRNYGQTEFDIGQCRRDCPGFRAIEDRLDDVAAFFLSRQPTELYQARGLASRRDLVEQLDGEFGPGAVERGRVLFAQNCAFCHSSQKEISAATDFLKTDESGERIDWLGNDQATPASKVGTYRCRALHSNHMRGHVFGQYASETYHDRAGDPGLPDPTGGGRGYYRNISLINAWAYAPFMHNNALGPEVCGGKHEEDLYSFPYVKRGTLERLSDAEAPACRVYDPSVEGRYQLFKASMEDLLNPDQRLPKVTLTTDDVLIELGPRTFRNHQVQNVKLRMPAGQPAGLLESFQYKLLADDLVLALTHPERLGKEKGQAFVDTTLRIAKDLVSHLGRDDVYTVSPADAAVLLKRYATCTADVENDGHRFGADLSPQDKKALTAFLATL